ncbi:MAG: phosphoserine phosphatase SerB [Pseudomonadota bacterium]|jgi:phosphoserine phosphatase
MADYAIVVTAPPGGTGRLGQDAVQTPAKRWLGPQAFEWIDPAPSSGKTAQLVREWWHDKAQEIAAHGLDVNVVDTCDRRKRLLVADMESTIIEQEMLDELADLVGMRERVADITARAMRGELDFEAAIKERVALLAGLDASVLDELANSRITYMPGARTLVATMKANGAYCALVSGGFTHFTAKVAAELGFDEHRANRLEIVDGKLTGRVIEPILGREAKREALTQLTGRLQLDKRQSIAVGDGANDISMLEAAGIGVAFRAKPVLRDLVATLPDGAVITHSDLTALLYLQGYTEDAFVAA